VQERIPLKMGAMKGPRSFEAAGEIADGMHHALGYSREAYDYAVEHVGIGADRAGRDIDDLDLGAWVVFVVSEDSAAAKQAARIITAFYIPSMPPELLARHGVDLEGIQPINDAFAAGDVAKAVDLTTPELAEKLSMAGTPEECVEKIKTNIQAAGMNHMILAVTDSDLVEFFTEKKVENVPDVRGQLKLIAERIMPAFA
jgi:5,10-methylenetetrahydromethanopterin reductase